MGLIYLKIFQKMRMSEKCRNNNNNSDNPLTSRRNGGDKKQEHDLSLRTGYFIKPLQY